MLSLMLKEGEYLTIGEDIAIQVFHGPGAQIQVAVKAPREMTILRGEVRERGGAKRPAGLVGPLSSGTPRIGTKTTKSVSPG